MHSPRVRMFALALAVGVVGILVAAGPAGAQCTPNPPTGTSEIPTCATETGGHTATNFGGTILYLPVRAFLRNPVVATAAWVVASRPFGTREGIAVEPKGTRGWMLRGGRSPKQVAW